VREGPDPLPIQRRLDEVRRGGGGLQQQCGAHNAPRIHASQSAGARAQAPGVARGMAARRTGPHGIRPVPGVAAPILVTAAPGTAACARKPSAAGARELPPCVPRGARRHGCAAGTAAPICRASGRSVHRAATPACALLPGAQSSSWNCLPG